MLFQMCVALSSYEPAWDQIMQNVRKCDLIVYKVSKGAWLNNIGLVNLKRKKRVALKKV